MFADSFQTLLPEEWAQLIKANPNLYLVIFLHFDDNERVSRISGLKRTATSWATFYGEIEEAQDSDYFDVVDDVPEICRRFEVIDHVATELSKLASTDIGKILINTGGRKGLILKAFEKKYSRLSLFILYRSRLAFDKKFFPQHTVLKLKGEEVLNYMVSRVFIVPSKDSTESYNFVREIHKALMEILGFDSNNPLKKWKVEFHKKVCDIMLENNLKTPEEIIEFFMYENMKEKYPDFCPLYKEGKTCHEKLPKEKFNCFFCACPHFISHYYDRAEKKFGGCVINAQRGKYNEHGYWDCSECYFIHHSRYALRYLREHPWILSSICWRPMEEEKEG